MRYSGSSAAGVIVGMGGKCGSPCTLKVELICYVDRYDGWLMDMSTLSGKTVVKDAKSFDGGGAAI